VQLVELVKSKNYKNLSLLYLSSLTPHYISLHRNSALQESHQDGAVSGLNSMDESSESNDRESNESNDRESASESNDRESTTESVTNDKSLTTRSTLTNGKESFTDAVETTANVVVII
jgi:E3 ubiquitin-protein ligase DOA10